MARKRPSTKALYSGTYSPARAAAAKHRKRTPGPKTRAKLERALAKTQRPTRSPKPGTAAGRRRAERLLGPATSWPAEARYLKDQARSEALGRRDAAGSLALWHEYLDSAYAPAYRAAVREKGARTRAARKASPTKSEWIRVRAHKRRRPR